MKKEAWGIYGRSLCILAAVLLTACAAPSEAESSRNAAEGSLATEEEVWPACGTSQGEVLPSGEDGSSSGSGSEEGVLPPSGEGSGEDGVPEDLGGAAKDRKTEITLVMVGDILLHTPVAKSGLLAEGGYDFSAVFEEMKEEISAADLALVNQEVIIGGEELGITGYPAFNAPYELGDALAEAG